MVPDPAVLFALFVAWHGLNLGVAGYLYFMYGEEYFSKCGDPEKEAQAERENAMVVKGFATGDLPPSPSSNEITKEATTTDETGVHLVNRRVTELKKLS